MLSPTARLGLLAAGAAASLTLLTGCGAAETGPSAPSPGSLITSTTQIAGAGVLGNDRRPDESCAPAPSSTGPGAIDASRSIRNAVGDGATIPPNTEVRGDPQRIVAFSADQLDALCVLGLQGRVVGTASPQPSYLGTVLHDAPALGEAGAPDLEAIRAADPDLILGSPAQPPDTFGALTEIAPTVWTGDGTGADWQDTLHAVAAATGRSGAADAVLNAFERDAHAAGERNDATHFQASIVQFTSDTMRVYGAANFPAAVLHTVGVDRPAAQRFTDKPFVEVSIADLDNDTDLSVAEGDVIYLSFASPEAKERAETVLDSSAWRNLSANKDGRVFAVNNEIWQTGRGVVAARGIVADLRWLNSPIN